MADNLPVSINKHHPTQQASSPPLNLENLSKEILHSKIFDYLNINDLLVLKLTSKKLYSLVDTYKVEELWVSSNEHISLKDVWFTTTRSNDLRKMIHSHRIFLLRSLSAYLSNLKYLKIDDFKEPIKLSDLNKFIKLEILYIYLFRFSRSDCLLQLPALKALSFRLDMYNDKDNLDIDTPNLNSLDYYSYNLSPIDDRKVYFVHAYSIKYLRINDDYEKRASIFKNLECLEINNLKGFSKEDLLKFKNLKKFRIDQKQPSLRFLKEDIKKMKELFSCKKDLDFVLAGVLIKDIKQIDEYEYDIFKFQMKNYNDLEDSIFSTAIRYDAVVKLFPTNRPFDLCSKYININIILINAKIEDENLLANFIIGCKNLSSFAANMRSSLSQKFYDNLPAISSLISLTLLLKDVLDFRFITKISYLSQINTNQDVLMGRDLNLNNLKNFHSLCCKINNKKIVIEKGNTDDYFVPLYGNERSKYFNFDQLVEWTNNLRNVNA